MPVRSQVGSRAGPRPLRPDEHRAGRRRAILEDGSGLVTGGLNIHEPLGPVHTVLHAAQQQVAHLLAVHPASGVGRDLELDLPCREVEEKEVATVVRSHIGIDLNAVQVGVRLLVEEMLEVGQDPV